MENSTLEKLRGKQKALDARIQLQQNRENERNRKLKLRRQFLAGSAALAEAEQNPNYKKKLYRLLSQVITNAHDRELLGLPLKPRRKRQTATK